MDECHSLADELNDLFDGQNLADRIEPFQP
jgi:hypothetical protein